MPSHPPIRLVVAYTDNRVIGRDGAMPWHLPADLAHFKRSLALKERMGDRHGQASTLNNIALLYEKTGAPSLALDHYEQSYEILNTLEDPRADIVQENIAHLRTLMAGGTLPLP